MPKPRSPDQWAELFADKVFQSMLPQDQIKTFEKMARKDPMLSNTSSEDLLKLRNQFQGRAQAINQARSLGNVKLDPTPMTRAEDRADRWQTMQETAHPGDVFKAATSQVNRLPFGIGPSLQTGLEAGGESLIRAGASTVRGMGALGEGFVKNVPLDLPEGEQPDLSPMPVEPIARAERMKKERERVERNRGLYAEERAQAGRETAKTFFDAAEKIDTFASRFGRDKRTSWKNLRSKDGWQAQAAAAPELIFQTAGDVVGYAIPYVLGPAKFRDAYLLLTGTGEVADRAYEKDGTTNPEFTIPAGALFAVIERAFGPEAWARVAERSVSEPLKKLATTFLKDPKSAAGLAKSVLFNFFRYGTPEAVTEGAQQYIVTQAKYSDEPKLTLDTWNGLTPDEKDEITDSFASTLLTLGLVGTIKGHQRRGAPAEVDAGPAPAVSQEVFFDQPKTKEQQVADMQAAAPVADRYRSHAASFTGNPEMQKKFNDAADSVTIVEPSDRFTLVAREIAQKAGFNVKFFTDNLGRDPETQRTAEGVRVVVMNNDTGDMLVRVDPNNTRAAAGNIIKGMLAQLVLEDPPRVAAIAEILKVQQPALWKAATEKAKQFGVKIDDNLGILSVAAEMSAPDVIAAYSNPQLAAEIAKGEAGDSEIFSGLASPIARYGRKFIENFINPRLVNNFSPGSLRYAMREMGDVPMTARDVDGRKALAQTAQLLSQQLFPDGSRRVNLSTSDRQPIIFENMNEGGASDYDIGPRNIAEQGTKWSRWVDDMFQKWVDDRLMVRDVERQIKEQSIPLTDDVAIAQTIDTQNSRVAEAARRIEQDHLKRIERMLLENIPRREGRFGRFLPQINFKGEFQKFGDYMLAKQALERNRYLLSIGKPADSSGMSDRRANEILERTELEGRTEAYEAALNVALEVPNLTLREMLDSGLITIETYQNVRAAYPRYLPMMSEMLQEAVGDERLNQDETGTAVDVNTANLIRRVDGTTEERDMVHPLRQLFTDSLIRLDMVERNRTMQTVYRFAQKWGGKEMKAYQSKPSSDSGVRSTQLSVYFDGVPHVIEFDSVGKRNQFANLSNKKLHTFFRLAGALTNLKARAATTFSIPFWFVNFPRDLITGYLQSDSEEMGIQMLRNTPMSLRAILVTEFPQFAPQEVTPELQHAIERYELYRENGGQLSFMGLREMYRDLNKLVHNLGDDRVGVLHRMRQFVDLMDNMSSVLENTTRLAAFNAAIDSGATPRAAAYYGRNITVDFDRKTESARKLNTLYVFANANLQGTSRILRAMWKSPHGRRTLMQYSMIGFLSALLSRITNPEDYDRISDDEKSRNLIFLNPDGTFDKIPLPPGLAFFFRMGSFAEEIAFDDKPRSKLDTLLTPLGMLMDEFSPLSPSRISGSGFGGNLYGYIRPFMPTGLQEGLDIAQNQSVWGQEIYPEPGKYNRESPRSELMFGDEKSTLQRRISRPLTKKLNELGGGNEAWPGTIGDADFPGQKIRSDYSPEVFEYLLESFFSGPLAFTNRAFKLAQHYNNVANDREVPPIHENMIPVLRRFHSRATDYEIGDEYYSIRDTVNQAENVLKSYDAGDLTDEQFDKWYDRNGWMLDLTEDLDWTEKELTDLRKNRTESTYRADSERRMKLQRAVVESYYDLWTDKRGSKDRREPDKAKRFYDESALRVATDQMGMLSQMIRSQEVQPEVKAKYLETHGWKRDLLGPYLKWYKASMDPENHSEETVMTLQNRFLDAWYDKIDERNKKPRP